MNVRMFCIGDATANIFYPRTKDDIRFELVFNDRSATIHIEISYNHLKQLNTGIDISLEKWEKERLKQRIIDEL